MSYCYQKCPFCEQRVEHGGQCGCKPRANDPTPEQIAIIVGKPPVDDTFNDDVIEIERRLNGINMSHDPLAKVICNGCVSPCNEEFFIKHYDIPNGLTEPNRLGKIAECVTHNELHRKPNNIVDR